MELTREQRQSIGLANSVIMVADKFIGKVESGRARSVETYSDMKKLKAEATLIKDIITGKETVKEWLIWSIEHNAWWCENQKGYTEDIENAGKYSYETAIQIVKGANYFEGQRYNENTKGAVKPNEAMILADWVK